MSDLPKLPDLTGYPSEGSMNKQKRKQMDSQDYYKIAEEVGLKDRADQLLAQKGEEAKTIFSGGFISDVFDTLNALQYGVVGVLKGKGFMEGMRTRQSFSDKDALGEFGIPGWVLGTVLDIAVDPITYLTPWKVLSKIPALKTGAKAAKQAWVGTKVGNWMARKFIWMGGQDPVFRETFERMSAGMAKGQFKARQLLAPISKLDEPARKALFAARTTGDWSKIGKKTIEAAMPAFNEVDRLSRELVENGILKAETVDRTIGTYLPRLFDYFENPTSKTMKALNNSKKISAAARKRLLKRKDVPPELLDALGEITEAGYPTAKALTQMTELAEKGKMFNTLAASNLAWKGENIEQLMKTAGVGAKEASKLLKQGFVQLPTTKGLGALSGNYVHKPMADYLNEMIRKPKGTEKVWKKIVGGFKFGKVIMNPATHARNIASNTILNSFEGLNPIEAPMKFMSSYAKATKAVLKKDDLWKAAKGWGLANDTYMSREIMDLFGSAEGMSAAGKFRKMWRNTGGRLGDLYQKEEEFAKMAQFAFQMDNMGAKTIKGLNKFADNAYLVKNGLPEGLKIGEAATRIAERATFNYAQVSPFVRKLRESMWGMPFITFCLSDDTEILTQVGWKRCYDVERGDQTLAYNIKTKELEWQDIETVNIFPYMGEMLHLKSRSLDILMTPDHRCVVDRPISRRIGNWRKGDNRRKPEENIQVVLAKDLIAKDHVIVAGDYISPTKEIYEDKMVRLIGWMTTEGWIKNWDNSMMIGQTNPEGKRQIEELRKEWGIDHHFTRSRRFPNGNGLHTNYYIPAWVRDKFLAICPNKELNVRFLKKLTRRQLEILYDVLLLADGCDSSSNDVIVQNPGETADAIQALGVMLGKQFNFCRHGELCLSITCTKKNRRQLRRNMPKQVDYWGMVWCPTTKYSTWVARRNGKVFITGNSAGATKAIGRTALKAPGRISWIGKVKNNIERLANQGELKRERKSEPPWVKDGFFIKLPMKDKHGRSAYFDMTYIIPFGDLVSGQIFERQIDRETGTPESHIEGMLKKAPLINLITELGKNQDFYGNKIWKDSDTTDKQLGDVMRHLTKTYAPPLLADQLPGGYITKGKKKGTRRPGVIPRVKEAGAVNQYRHLGQEVLRNFGMKVQPINVEIQEGYAEYERRKALQTLLSESGELREYTRFYQPKK